MKEYIIKADFITEGDELVAPEIVSKLIRCKDCRYHDGRNRCEMWDMYKTDANDFCSYAEPKETEK